jgi:hypothetical protein
LVWQEQPVILDQSVVEAAITTIRLLDTYAFLPVCHLSKEAMVCKLLDVRPVSITTVSIPKATLPAKVQ